jgi:hypothetical protein
VSCTEALRREEARGVSFGKTAGVHQRQHFGSERLRDRSVSAFPGALRKLFRAPCSDPAEAA